MYDECEVLNRGGHSWNVKMGKHSIKRIPFIPMKDGFLPFMRPGGSSKRFIVH